MSLKHAILVLLDTQPGSGYDLVKHFKGSLGYFWNAKHQQVYQQLKMLSEQGLIQSTVEEQSGKPDKKIYAITDSGAQELVHWLEERTLPYKYNDALLVKIYGGKHLEESVLMDELHHHVELHKQILDELLAIEVRYQNAAPKVQHKLHLPYVTLRRGILGEKAWLEWAEEARIHIRDFYAKKKG